MRVGLIGGERDGDTTDVQTELRVGDIFQVPVWPPIPFSIASTEAPERANTHVIYYQLCDIHIDRDHVVSYGVPPHWTDRDGLVALFGQPRWH